MQQDFGGPWTVLKLQCLRQYLQAFVKVMKNQDFTTHYIDAFAGTGYVELRTDLSAGTTWLPECDETETASRSLLQGSAEQALDITPPFDQYVFIEQSEWRKRQLDVLRARNLDMWGRIDVIRGDANAELRRLCSGWDRRRCRGVVFLDPFGMTVEWPTLEAIAQTESLDLWYLFPISAVNRLLARDGDLPDGWIRRLNTLFGTETWQTEFFRRRQEQTLFGRVESVRKVCDWDTIRTFLLNRLQGLFPAVAPNPLLLCNSTDSPLFLLCFAVSNRSQAAVDAAMRIAGHILRAA